MTCKVKHPLFNFSCDGPEGHPGEWHKNEKHNSRWRILMDRKIPENYSRMQESQAQIQRELKR